MRYIAIILFLLTFKPANSQKFMCKDGVTKFTSEAPLELIKAESNKTAGVIDIKSKNVAFSIEVESFHGFNSGLQREHFLENYMETEKFPKATFKGKIIEDIDFTKNGTFMVRCKGILSLHGIDKEKIIKVKIIIKEGEIYTDCTFDIPLEDHNISVPKVVNKKIASLITIDVKASLKAKS
jgi:polyisoprenoid-binding protein YceI